MAITVIGGLAVSTLLTLVVIPIMYDRLDRKPDAHYKARGDAARAAAAKAARLAGTDGSEGEGAHA
jgi:HAE1 family hydrophobic/amphiphilic exporter-1